MDLSNLKPAKVQLKVSKRIGRGQGSGKCGTATGQKEQIPFWIFKENGFEGGQCYFKDVYPNLAY